MRAPLLAAIEMLIKETFVAMKNRGFEPDPQVPLTNGAGLVAKNQKTRPVPGRRGTKGVPSNWEGFDAPMPKPARRNTNKPAGSTARTAGKVDNQSSKQTAWPLNKMIMRDFLPPPKHLISLHLAPDKIRDFPGKRWVNLALRTMHYLV